ncbi:MAG: helix-turn-helix transcriptional regulator [Pseudomonadales bacterium]|nr:helix-turn-helix transcriptional regulator [Pseudomonadales bacterium]
MQPTIPPPFEPAITFTSLLFVVGAALAILLAIALWRKQSQNDQCADGRVLNPNAFLAVLMISIAVVLLENFLDSTGYFYYLVPLMSTHVPFGFLAGPSLYFYVCTVTSPEPPRYRPVMLLHLIPAALILVTEGPLYFDTEPNARMLAYYAWAYPVEVDLDVLNPGFFNYHAIIFLESNVLNTTVEAFGPVGWVFIFNIQTSLEWYMAVASLMIYSGFSFLKVRQHTSNLHKLTSSMENIDLRWVNIFLTLLMLVAAMYVLKIAANYIFSTESYNQLIDLVIYVALSCGIVYLGTKALMQTTIFSPQLVTSYGATAAEKSAASPGDFQADDDPVAAVEVNGKYGNSALPVETSKELAATIRRKFETDKLYLISDLTLPDLAGQLELTTHVVSQVLNDTIGQNFYDFVNGYRVEEAKRWLESSDFRNRAISQIAQESGFNSSSAFYNAFRKKTGMTPSQWRDRHSH